MPPELLILPTIHTPFSAFQVFHKSLPRTCGVHETATCANDVPDPGLGVPIALGGTQVSGGWGEFKVRRLVYTKVKRYESVWWVRRDWGVG